MSYHPEGIATSITKYENFNLSIGSSIRLGATSPSGNVLFGLNDNAVVIWDKRKNLENGSPILEPQKISHAPNQVGLVVMSDTLLLTLSASRLTSWRYKPGASKPLEKLFTLEVRSSLVCSRFGQDCILIHDTEKNIRVIQIDQSTGNLILREKFHKASLKFVHDIIVMNEFIVFRNHSGKLSSWHYNANTLSSHWKCSQFSNSITKLDQNSFITEHNQELVHWKLEAGQGKEISTYSMKNQYDSSQLRLLSLGKEYIAIYQPGTQLPISLFKINQDNIQHLGAFNSSIKIASCFEFDDCLVVSSTTGRLYAWAYQEFDMERILDQNQSRQPINGASSATTSSLVPASDSLVSLSLSTFGLSAENRKREAEPDHENDSRAIKRGKTEEGLPEEDNADSHSGPS